MPYKLPLYRPLKYTKQVVYTHIGNRDAAVAFLGVTNTDFRNWGKYIPAPYADRLLHSKWGELPLEPRYVLTEDALIIFKTFGFMAKHFGRVKSWSEGMLYLPELESGYMIRLFPQFMRVFTESELKQRHLL